MRILLVRHGQTDSNHTFIPGKVRPKTEPINRLGVQQVHEAAAFIKSQPYEVTQIISSPYTRALQTAEILSESLKLSIETSDKLREYNPGEWEGKHKDDIGNILNKVTADERYKFRPPAGESWLDEAERFKEAVSEIEHLGKNNVIFVSHYDPIKAVINLLTNIPPELWQAYVEYPPGSVTVLERRVTKWNLVAQFKNT